MLNFALAPLLVGGRSAALNVGNIHKAAVWVHVKEKPPVANSAAKGGAFVLEGLHIAREGVMRHFFFKHAQEPFAFGAWCACEALLSAF